MIEVPINASVERALEECLNAGLRVRSSREIAGRPGSHHYHLAYPDRPGTLELSESRGVVWFSINERRDCGWVTEFARSTAAAVRDDPPSPRAGR